MSVGKKQEVSGKVNLKDRNALGNLMIELLEEFEHVIVQQVKTRKRIEKKLAAVKAQLDEIEGRA